VHELSLAQAIWRQVVGEMERRPQYRLTALSVVVGAFSGADPESLGFAMRLMVEESTWPGAETRIRTEPVALKCRTCGRAYETETLDLACPGCGGYDVEVTGGRDLRLESLEVVLDDGETHSS
jgi:hydrogenase nickel incorporation protein HypA/HybF